MSTNSRTTRWSTLLSHEDSSANFVRSGDDGGLIEARYVRRRSSYAIGYLSSHTGCEMACRMCHLTATGQTTFGPVTPEGFVEQAETVLDHYRSRSEPAARINWNFMARGEPLANPHVLDAFTTITDPIRRLSVENNFKETRFKISTIFPKTMADRNLSDVLKGVPDANLYYSLYSLDEGFRKRWLPKALPPEQALSQIATWQRETHGKVVLHWALIAGENDRDEDVRACLEAALRHGIQPRFNIVRYNPFSDRQGSEPEADVRERIQRIGDEILGTKRARLIDRIGHDVKASCGMFIDMAA
jgi:23S rRNA (adenine2503-C2)-methyltransferase